MENKKRQESGAKVNGGSSPTDARNPKASKTAKRWGK